jgi:hypothetical protein
MCTEMYPLNLAIADERRFFEVEGQKDSGAEHMFETPVPTNSQSQWQVSRLLLRLAMLPCKSMP